MRIASGRTDAKLSFVAVDSTDLKTRKTGLSSFTVYRSRNGGTATAYTTPTIAELDSTNMPGVYVLTVDEDTTITSGVDEEEYVVHITQVSMAPVTRAVELFRPKGTEGRTLDVSSGGEAGVDWANVGSPTTTVTLSGTTVKTATDVETDTQDIQSRLPAALGANGNIKADVRDFSGTAGTFSSGRPEVNTTHAAGTAWGSGAITAASIASNAITAAKIADAAIDRATFAADTGMQTARSNTAQAGAAGSMTLDASASSTTDFYKGMLVVITGGTGVGQARFVTAYNGTTKVATVGTNWATNPDNTSTFAVVSCDNATPATAIAAVQADTDDIQTRLPAALVSGRIDASVGAMASGVVTASAVATGAIDADALAADAVTEIVDGVWDDNASNHLTAGTTGAALSDAGSAGDPWSTALPGAYADGTAGQIIGDYLDAAVSTRATQTSVDTIDNFVDTEVAAIASAVADIQSRLPAALISGRMDATVGAMQSAVVTATAIATDAITAAKIAAGAVDASAIATDAGNKIADHVLRRNLGSIADGDSEAFRSLLGAVRKLVNKVAVSGSTLTVYKEDDSTSAGTQAVTTDAAAEPITGVDTA